MKLLKMASLTMLLSLGLVAFGCQKKDQTAPKKTEEMAPQDENAPDKEKAEDTMKELKENTLSIVKEGGSQPIAFYHDTEKTMKEGVDATTPDMDDMDKKMDDADELKEKMKKEPTDEDMKKKLDDAQDDAQEKMEEMKDSVMPMGDK